MKATAIIMSLVFISLGNCNNWFRDYVEAKDEESQVDDNVDLEADLDEGKDLKDIGVNKIMGSCSVGMAFSV